MDFAISSTQGASREMPVKLTTTINNLQLLENATNSKLIFEFYTYLESKQHLEKVYQNQNIKALINFAKFLGPTREFLPNIKKRRHTCLSRTRRSRKQGNRP